MKKIAFLISDKYYETVQKCPDFLDEYQLLKPIFNKFDAELTQVDWKDTSIDWKQFDTLIPKACWDYTQHSLQFEQFLDRMISFNLRMKNTAEIIKWNMRKTYLIDLKNQGYPVGDLVVIPQNSTPNLTTINDILKTLGGEKFVAKPSISAAAKDTIRFTIKEVPTHEALFTKILNQADLVLQPYFAEIAEEGEYSFFFFKNEFSHAILKKPTAGDYRAHQLFGAKHVSYQPSPQEIQLALQFIQNISPNYARVDVFRKNNQFFLIELELIEPYLYFEVAPKESPIRFCEAILNN